jgi:hypothetical protein
LFSKVKLGTWARQARNFLNFKWLEPFQQSYHFYCLVFIFEIKLIGNFYKTFNVCVWIFGIVFGFLMTFRNFKKYFKSPLISFQYEIPGRFQFPISKVYSFRLMQWMFFQTFCSERSWVSTLILPFNIS